MKPDAALSDALVSRALDDGLRGLSYSFLALPAYRRALASLQIERGLRYGGGVAQLYDRYAPRAPAPPGLNAT